MLKGLREFEDTPPQIVFSWKDTETEAEGWLVINSLRGGASAGGTRMRKGVTEREMTSLAKIMEIKFQVASPPIGGGKSGINFDPDDPRKEGVLTRWYQAVAPFLKTYYGTGGDLNVDEIKEVLPITSSFGVLHPLEGVVTGHITKDPKIKEQIIKQLQDGIKKVITNKNYIPDTGLKYTVADMVTGYGTAVSVLHYYDMWHGKESYKGKKVLLQGFGNVGAPIAFYLTQAGMKIVCILDKEGAVLNHDGFSLDEINELLKTKKDNLIHSANKKLYSDMDMNDIWSIGADVLIPAANSRVITKEIIDTMLDNGLELISSGANIPFKDKEIFFGPIELYADEKVSLVSDFISNCGIARVFAYLMMENAIIEDEHIFNDVSENIRKRLLKTYEVHKGKTHLAQKAMEIIFRDWEDE